MEEQEDRKTEGRQEGREGRREGREERGRESKFLNVRFSHSQ